MKRVATAAVLIPLVLLAVLRAPTSVFLLILALIALQATREYLQLVRSPLLSLNVLSYAGVLLVFVAFWALSRTAGPRGDVTVMAFLASALLVAGLLPLFALSLGMRAGNLTAAPAAAALSVLAPLYVGFPLAAIAGIRDAPFGGFWLLFLLVVVWIGDIVAYYVGKSMGRHLLAPRISPKKTWEGAVASLAAALIAGMLLPRFLLPMVGAWSSSLPAYLDSKPPSMLAGGLTALVLNIGAQFGDLAESMLKRAAAVKDSGSLLPGHGGLLDRIDALLFAAPLLWYIEAFATVMR